MIHAAKVPIVRKHGTEQSDGSKWTVSLHFPKGALDGLIQHTGLLLSVQPYLREKSHILNFMYAYVDPVTGPGLKNKLNLGFLDDKVIAEASKHVTKYTDDLINGISTQLRKLEIPSRVGDAEVFVILDDVWDDSPIKLNMPLTEANKLRKNITDVETFLASVWKKMVSVEGAHTTKVMVVCQGEQVPPFLVEQLGTPKCKAAKLARKGGGRSRTRRTKRQSRKSARSRSLKRLKVRA